MGKAALIATLAVGLSAILYLNNSHEVERDTDQKNTEHYNNQAVRELALNGRRLVVAGWMQSGGVSASAPFSTMNQAGGQINVTNYNLSGNVLDFTVQANLNGAVHEVRSRFRWDTFGLNPVQLRVPDIDLTLSPDAELDITNIALDDQSLLDLENIIVDELSLAESLNELDLGASQLITELQSELTSNGFSSTGVTFLDQAYRDAHDDQMGVFFTEQVQQSINTYISNNPSTELNLPDVAPLNGIFDHTSGHSVLRIQGDLNLANNLTGEGILIVEGDINIPNGVNFDWDGLILMQPPFDHLSPQLNLSGNVDINGSLIVIQEGMPNTGHMDFTVFLDNTGNWYNTTGSHYPWWRHKHDFTSAYGNDVIHYSEVPGVSDHRWNSRFADLLNMYFSPTDSLFFEYFNSHNHGRGIFSLKLAGNPMTSFPVAVGFDPLIAAPGNPMRTQRFRASDVEHLEIMVTRLSSLKRMWDSGPTGYPGCPNYDNLGPGCVAYTANRYDALTLRAYRIDSGVPRRVYDASLYWHRRQDEEDEFEEEMTDLLTEINSSNFGLDMTVGPNTRIIEDPFVLSTMSAFGGLGIGLAHLGTWHKHWGPDDPANPVTQANYTQ